MTRDLLCYVFGIAREVQGRLTMVSTSLRNGMVLSRLVPIWSLFLAVGKMLLYLTSFLSLHSPLQ